MTNLEAYSSIKKEVGGDIERAKAVFRERYGYDVVKENLDEEIRITDAGPAPEAGPRPEAGPPPATPDAGPAPTPDAGPSLDAGPTGVSPQRPAAGPGSIFMPDPFIFRSEMPEGPPIRFKEDVVQPLAEIGAKGAGIVLGMTGLPTSYRIGRTIETGFKLRPLTAELRAINDQLDKLPPDSPKRAELIARGEKLSAEVKQLEKGLKPDPIVDTYKNMQKTAKERMGKDFYDNWTASSAQVKESTIALLAQLADVEQKDETITEGMKRAFFEGAGMPEQLVGGAVGMLAHVIANPIDSFNTQPAEVILTFAPFIPKLAGLARAGNTSAQAALADLAGKPGVIAGLKRMGAKGLDKAFQVVDKPLPEVRGRRPVKRVPVEEVAPGEFTSGLRPMTVGDVVAAAGKGGVLGLLVDLETAGVVLGPLISTLRGYKPGLGTETLRRWLVDNAANSDLRLQALTRRIQFEPEIVADEITRAGKGLARESERIRVLAEKVDNITKEMQDKGRINTLSDVWQGLPQTVALLDDLEATLPFNEYLAVLDDAARESLAMLDELRANPDAAVAATGGKVAMKATDLLLPEFEAKLRGVQEAVAEGNVVKAESLLKEVVDDLAAADKSLGSSLLGEFAPPGSRVQPVIAGGGRPLQMEVFSPKGERYSPTSAELGPLRPDFESPAMIALMDRIQGFLPDDANVRSRLHEALTEAANNNLADGRVMRGVLNELVRRGIDKAVAKRELQKLLERHRKGERVEQLVFGEMGPGGKLIKDTVTRVMDIIEQEVAKIPKIREAILMETVGQIGLEASKATRKNLIDRTAEPYRDFSGQDIGPNTAAGRQLLDRIVQNDVLGNQALFALPEGVDPLTLARAMDDGYIDTKARQISGPELSFQAAALQLRNLRTRLENMKEYKGRYLDGTSAKALEWFESAHESLAGKDSSWNQISQWVKRHITVGNAASAINNAMANMILQSIRRSMTLPEYTARMVEIRNLYRRYLNDPDSLPPNLRAKLDVLNKTGEIGSDRVAVELLMDEGGSIHQSVAKYADYIPERLRKAIIEGTWNGKLAQEAYRYGDTLPKLEEGLFNLNRTIKDLNETLRPGESARLITKQGEVTTVTRTETGWRIKGKDYRSLEDAGALEVIGEAAMQPGRQLFFNYSDTGRLGKMLRSAPLIGIASPFYTWFSKAFAGPGGGLVGNTFRGTSSVIFDTDSAALNARQLKHGAADSLARATLSQAQDIETRRAKDRLRQILSFRPQVADALLVGQVVDPAFLRTKSIGSWSFDGPFNMGLRNALGIYSLAQQAIDPKTAKELLKGAETPEDKRRMALWIKQQAGERANLSDMLEIVGLAGGPIVDVWQTLKNDGMDKWGRKLTIPRILQKFGGAVVGSTAVREGELFWAGLQEAGLAEGVPRDVTVDIKQMKEMFPAYAVRKLFGLGLRPTLLAKVSGRKGAIDRYAKAFEKKLKASLVGSYKKEVKALAAAGKREEAKALARDAAMWNAVIKSEVGKAKSEIMEVYDLLKVLEKR